MTIHRKNQAIRDYQSNQSIKPITDTCATFTMVSRFRDGGLQTLFVTTLDLSLRDSCANRCLTRVRLGVFYPSLTGGAYPSFRGDFLLLHRVGIEGDIAWRASQGLYGGFQPYRPIFYSFNAIWAPKLAKPITAELLAGIGGENLRFIPRT